MPECTLLPKYAALLKELMVARLSELPKRINFVVTRAITMYTENTEMR